MSERNGRKAFYTIREVADLVQVHQRTVRRWIHAKSLPAHRLGRQWRISKDDLHVFLAQRYHGVVPDII